MFYGVGGVILLIVLMMLLTGGSNLPRRAVRAASPGAYDRHRAP
jgi:hypothetical protein